MRIKWEGIMSEPGIDDALRELLSTGRSGDHPERYILGKPHPDRAKQFKPFAALRGYDEAVKETAFKLNEEHESEL